MELKTYRAKSLQDALRLVRRDLGPEAAVLHTREVRQGVMRWFAGRMVEVTASAEVNVPSRLPETKRPWWQASGSGSEFAEPRAEGAAWTAPPEAHQQAFRARVRDDLKAQINDLHSMVEQLCRKSAGGERELPESLFRLFTDLLDAEVSEELARELVERVGRAAGSGELNDADLLKARMARLVEDEIACCGPINVASGQRKLVALVGPTGVGKTTTIAKLAANYHLRERHRVGLITVDTYRIAAVDQLRTYADIIELPMEVVATARDMRAALDRLADLDLILMDTAGRSPRDEVRIQELKAMLAEAQADEVHLVLSAVSSPASSNKAAARFSDVGATSLILTKLDEATGLGSLLPILRGSRLPISYVTNGQNVPDDIAPANRQKLARVVLGMEAQD